MCTAIGCQHLQLPPGLDIQLPPQPHWRNDHVTVVCNTTGQQWALYCDEERWQGEVALEDISCSSGMTHFSKIYYN